MLSTTLVGWLINAAMAYVTDCAHAFSSNIGPGNNIAETAETVDGGGDNGQRRR
jgi:hypothetical protein